MIITAEEVNTLLVGLQAIGTVSAIIYGVVRIERRFTRLEVNMDWMKKQCPNCTRE